MVDILGTEEARAVETATQEAVVPVDIPEMAACLQQVIGAITAIREAAAAAVVVV